MDSTDMNLASGIAAFEAKEFRRSLQLLQPLAEGGDPEAQYRLAVQYQAGLGCVQNPLQAYHWMREAAEQGHGLALHGLGYPPPPIVERRFCRKAQLDRDTGGITVRIRADDSADVTQFLGNFRQSQAIEEFFQVRFC